MRLAAALLVAGVAVAAAPGRRRPTQEAAIQQTTLDNGLQVLVVENHAVPLATVLIAVRGGALMQEAGDQGLAHLFEHLLFRSYAGDPSAFGQEASSLDAQYNGTTADELVSYYLVAPSKNVMKAIGLLAQLVQKARFGDYDLKQERPVVLDELQRAASDPEEELERQAAHLLWGAFWSRKDVGGDSATLKGIGLGRLQETYDRYYVPNNAVLVVTGDVTANDVFAAARQRFGTWQRAPDPFADRPVPAVPELTAGAAALVARPVTHARILIELRGPSVGQDSTAAYAADALCGVLNERGSHFQHDLVFSGLFQTVRCSYEPLSHVGPLVFRGEATLADAPAALSALLGRLDQLDRLDGVTEEDLVIGRQRRRVESALALESAASLAPALASAWASTGVDRYGGYDDSVNARSLDDLRRFAQSFVANRPRVIAVLAPSATIERLRALLARAAGTPGNAP